MLDSPDDGLSIIALLADPLLCFLEIGDINEYKHGAVNLIVDSQVRAHAQRIDAALLAIHFLFTRANRLNDFSDGLSQCWKIQISLKVVNGPANIGNREV